MAAGPQGVWTQPHGLSGRADEIPVARRSRSGLPGRGADCGLSPRARSRRGGRGRPLRAGRRPIPPRGVRQPRGPGHRRPADRGPAREHFLQGAAAGRAQRRPFELRHRVLPNGRIRERRPRPLRQIRGLPRHSRSSALRGAARGRSRRRAHAGPRGGPLRGRRRRRNAVRGRGDELRQLQGRIRRSPCPRGVRPGRPFRQVLCGDPRGPRPGASDGLPARLDLPANDGELATSDRRAPQGVRRRQRPGPGGAVLPVRPLPADLARRGPARSRRTSRASGTSTRTRRGTPSTRPTSTCR